MTTYDKGKLYDLAFIDLRADPNQPRKSMVLQALEDLAASIRLKGIIQPLLFRVEPDNPHLLIVAGERRFKAPNGRPPDRPRYLPAGKPQFRVLIRESRGSVFKLTPGSPPHAKR